MTPDMVVDVGNSFTKIGIVGQGGVIDCRFTLTDIASPWLDDVKGFTYDRPLRWLVAGVNPRRQAEAVRWARARGDRVTEVTSYRQLPIVVDVERPEAVGLDRLIGCVAANRRRVPGRAAVTVDVGTAVTINRIDATGAFTGGLIMPGLGLMAKALHQNTAKLPLVDFGVIAPPLPPLFPARSTEAAICTGLRFAIAGAVRAAVQYARTLGDDPQLYLTGGGHPTIRGLIADLAPVEEDALNLYGLLITAETLP